MKLFFNRNNHIKEHIEIQNSIYEVKHYADILLDEYQAANNVEKDDLNTSNLIGALDYLKSLSYDRINFEKIKVALHSLFKLKSLNIPDVDEILDYYDYEKYFFNQIQGILDNKEDFFKNNFEYNREDYKFILDVLLNSKVSEENELKSVFSDICVKAVIDNKNEFPFESVDLDKLYVKKAESFADSMLKNDIETHIIYGLDEHVHGLTLLNSPKIFIGSEEIKNDPVQALVTTIHELVHKQQEEDIYVLKNVSVKNLIQISDIINREVFGEKFYNDNYQNIYSEIEAKIQSDNYILKYMNEKNLSVSPEKKQKMMVEINYFQNNVNSNEYLFRNINGVRIDYLTLLGQNIYNRPDLFDNFSQLKVLYKKQGDHVLPKERDELINDFIQYKTDNNQLNGDEEEIQNIYLYAISSMGKKQEEQEAKKQTDVMIEAMARGEIDTNGQPLIENTEEKSSGWQRGYTVMGILSLISASIIIGIIILSIMIK